MTSSYFTYEKAKVIQALRYHFITRKEIKLMIILINVFAILSAALFYFKKISPLAFLLSAFLWFIMMLMFWFILPTMIYKKSATFKDRFKTDFDEEGFTLENEQGQRSWAWSQFSSSMESPHFIHLYFDSRSFFIVPKDALSEDELAQARKLINLKIKK